MKKMLFLLVVILFAVSFLIAGIGCKEEASIVTDGVEEAVADETTAEEEAVAEEATAVAEEVVIRVWDHWSEEATNIGAQKIYDRFMEENPNIVIERQMYAFEDFNTVLPTALAGGTGPDVFQYDVGPGFAGKLQQAGLLLDLTDAYNDYGWGESLVEKAFSSTTYDGKIMGIANELEFLGIYYNKQIFEELGVGVPENYEEFIQICEKAQASGYTAVAFSDGDYWSAGHTWVQFALNLAKEKMDNILFGDDTYNWDDPDFIQAIKLPFVDMMNAGYLGPEPVAIKYAEMLPMFLEGKHAMEFTGSWQVGQIDEANPDFEVGIMFLPSIDGKPAVAALDVGSGYFVSAQTDYPEEAKKLMDFIYSPEVARIWVEDMGVQAPYSATVVDYDSFSLGPLKKTALEIIGTKEFKGYNHDLYVGTQSNDTKWSGFQAVLLGEKTPEQVAIEMQAAWEAEKEAENES